MAVRVIQPGSGATRDLVVLYKVGAGADHFLTAAVDPSVTMVSVEVPGMQGHYSDGTAELLPDVLQALGGLLGESFDVGRVVLGGWSEGGEGVRANLFAGIDVDGIAVADGIQSPFGSTMTSPKIAVWLPFVEAARNGQKAFRSSCSSIPTVLSSSTYDTLRMLVPALSGTACGSPSDPGVAADGNAVVYYTCGKDGPEHIAHLQILLPRMVSEALAAPLAAASAPLPSRWKIAAGFLGAAAVLAGAAYSGVRFAKAR